MTGVACRLGQAEADELDTRRRATRHATAAVLAAALLALGACGDSDARRAAAPSAGDARPARHTAPVTGPYRRIGPALREARFPRAAGWRIRVARSARGDPCRRRVTSAATVPWRDDADAWMPLRTVRRLQRDGIVLVVALSRGRCGEGPARPAARLPLRLASVRPGDWPGMHPGDPPLRRFRVRVEGRYAVDLWAFLRPGFEDRAQRMLDRLRWPARL